MDFVAVVPEEEGAGDLGVAELLVPDEVVDGGEPGEAYGGVGEGAEAERDLRAVAGGEAAGGGRRGWWRAEGGFFNARGVPPGHEAGEVFRIREEGEDGFFGVGKELFGGEVLVHINRG